MGNHTNLLRASYRNRVPIGRLAIEAVLHLSLCLLVVNLSAYSPLKFRIPPKNLGDGVIDLILWNPIQNCSELLLLLLGFEGFLVGRYARLHIAMAALMPALMLGVISAVEMILVAGTHNLWGIEVAIYFAMFTVPIFLGGVLGTCFRRWRTPLKPTDCSRCRYDMTGNVSGVCPECGLVLGDVDR